MATCSSGRYSEIRNEVPIDSRSNPRRSTASDTPLARAAKDRDCLGSDGVHIDVEDVCVSISMPASDTNTDTVCVPASDTIGIPASDKEVVSIEEGLNKVVDEVSMEDKIGDVEPSRLGDKVKGVEELKGERSWGVKGGEELGGEDTLRDKDGEDDNSNDRGEMVEEE